jgi:sigma-B regulation protein RsbU (phosphoserine phosphatase)
LSEENKKKKKQSWTERSVRFYKTYTSGLRYGDFKKLFTQESKQIYTHFMKEEGEKKKIKGFKDYMRFIGQIFWGFVLSMTPARRIIYGITFLLFVLTFFTILTTGYNSHLRQDMATLSVYIFVAMSFLLALELADKLSARGEIEIAREVQLSLLPPDDPNLPGLKIASVSSPAKEVGGDYYDFSSVNGKSCLAVGDVSGHGLAAGVLMAMAKSAWQTQLINNSEPTAVLATLNSIVRDAGDSRTLMTFISCLFDHEEKKMHFANAGHIYPLLIRKSRETAAWLETPGNYPLGVRNGNKYELVTQDLEDGDLLFFLSDGAIEAMNESGESYGYNRFAQSALNCREKEPSEILKCLLADLQKFVQEAFREDDLTIIVVRYSELKSA